MAEFYKLTQDSINSAKQSAELMINRFNKQEIEMLINNIKLLYNKYGELLIFSLNVKLVTEAYLKELGVFGYFNLNNSYFRDTIPGNKKEKIWSVILEKYDNIIYIEDDSDTVNKLKEISLKSLYSITLNIFKDDGSVLNTIISSESNKKIHFIHIDNCWLGNINLTKVIH